MKNTKRYFTFFICAILLLIILFDSPVAVIAVGENQSTGVQIDRLADGTSVLTDLDYGYKFTTPAGVYPIAIPAPADQITQLNDLIMQNNLPIEQDFIASLPADILRFMIVDLDPGHYIGDEGGLIGAPYINVAFFTPDVAIAPMINILKITEIATNTKITSISGQEVGIVEFSFSPEKNVTMSGKMLLFIRNGKLFLFLGITNLPDRTAVTGLIDNITESLEFFEILK